MPVTQPHPFHKRLHLRSPASFLCRMRQNGRLLVPLIVAGCQLDVLDPRGFVAASEKTILLDSLAIMLAIVVPTIVATLGFAWWFRSSNSRARYMPEWSYSGKVELVTWGIPLLTIMLLGGVAWVGSHELDPSVPIESPAKPVEIQAISLDWKWLFIYPNQHVASVNKLVIPAGTPIHFALTSASVMNAFFIPQLGSMIYTMNGMATQLNLIADKPGIYAGLSSHFSGDGFSDMHFEAEAVPAEAFNAWSAAAQSGAMALDKANYAELAKQSANVKPFTYKSVDPALFQDVVNQTIAPASGPAAGPHMAGISNGAEK